MSSVMGAISFASKEFNALNTKNTVQGIKSAYNLNAQIDKASLAKEEKKETESKEMEENPTLQANETNETTEEKDEMEL